MALESTGARCERLAQNLMSYGRIVPIEEIVGRIDAVDEGAIEAAARRVFKGAPTLAAVGPLGTLETLDGIARRFA
jgi:predicted Zn-dependent peptidase